MGAGIIPPSRPRWNQEKLPGEKAAPEARQTRMAGWGHGLKDDAAPASNRAPCTDGKFDLGLALGLARGCAWGGGGFRGLVRTWPAIRALMKAKIVRMMPILPPPSITWRPACYHKRRAMARSVSPCRTGLTEFSGGTDSAVSIFFRRSTKILAALTGIRHAYILLEKELRGPIVKRGNLVKNPLSLSNNGLIKIGGVV